MEKNVLWRELYAAAMLELDHGRLGDRILEAQTAIQKAVDERLASRVNGSAEELQALSDATYNLIMLQKMELSLPVPVASPQGVRSQRGEA